MEALFLQYEKCTTCKRAKKWLLENNISFQDRSIVDQNPTKEELRSWFSTSSLPLKKFFNTSGVLYKEMKLKDKLHTLSEEEQLELLATDGKLVKSVTRN